MVVLHVDEETRDISSKDLRDDITQPFLNGEPSEQHVCDSDTGAEMSAGGRRAYLQHHVSLDGSPVVRNRNTDD